MAGKQIPLHSKIKGIDIVTGLPATTGGPYATGNPVKPHGHPLAVAAQRLNKTGPFAEKGAAPPRNLQAEKLHQDTSTAQAMAKKAIAASENNIPPSTGTVTTPGTEAASTAPIKTPVPVTPPPVKVPSRQPQGMQKPTVTTQHVNTSTVQPAHAIPPQIKVKLDEEGDTSTNAGTKDKGTESA